MEWTIAIASPILAFVGAYFGHRRAARADDMLDRWRRREETMRMLRWAIEQTAPDHSQSWITGMATLEALLKSELLQPEDLDFVERIVRSARSEPDAYTRKREPGIVTGEENDDGR